MPASQGQRAPVSIAAPGGLAAPCRTCGSSASPWWGGCGPVVITAAQHLHPEVYDSETCRLTFLTKSSTANRVCPRHYHLCQLRARPSGPLRGLPACLHPPPHTPPARLGRGRGWSQAPLPPCPWAFPFYGPLGVPVPNPAVARPHPFAHLLGTVVSCASPQGPPPGVRSTLKAWLFMVVRARLNLHLLQTRLSKANKRSSKHSKINTAELATQSKNWSLCCSFH